YSRSTGYFCSVTAPSVRLKGSTQASRPAARMPSRQRFAEIETDFRERAGAGGPLRSERRHRGLARRGVAVRRRAVLVGPKASVHIHDMPTGTAAAFMMRPICFLAACEPALAARSPAFAVRSVVRVADSVARRLPARHRVRWR